MPRNLSNYVGRTLRHTPKAVSRGEPGDRRFTVCGTARDEGSEFLVAWKCTQVGELVRHPGYDDLMAVDDPRLFAMTAPSGAEPTATIVPDSLYMEA